jgi:hypothetical protein
MVGETVREWCEPGPLTLSVPLTLFLLLMMHQNLDFVLILDVNQVSRQRGKAVFF